MFTLLCLSLTDCVSSTIIFQICGSSDCKNCGMFNNDAMSNGASASLVMSALRWHGRHSAEVNENINLGYSHDQGYS